MTGLADALILCGPRYGSESAAAQAGDWARQVMRAAYLASARLAEEKSVSFANKNYLGQRTSCARRTVTTPCT